MMNDKYYEAVENALLAHMERQEERIKELESQKANDLVLLCTLYGMPVYCKPENEKKLTEHFKYFFRDILINDK